jgi:hypothetical protein
MLERNVFPENSNKTRSAKYSVLEGRYSEEEGRYILISLIPLMDFFSKTKIKNKNNGCQEFRLRRDSFHQYHCREFDTSS